jgi:hypothetical protein
MIRPSSVPSVGVLRITDIAVNHQLPKVLWFCDKPLKEPESQLEACAA